MRKNYDFSNAVRNPYARRLKRQLTIRLDEETIGYFQGLSREMFLPYQTLMNMYLRDCAESRMRPHWAVASTTKRANKLSKAGRLTDLDLKTDGKRLIITPLESERSRRGRLAKVQARALRRHAETFRKLAK